MDRLEPGAPAGSEEVTSPISSKVRGGWLLYIEQPSAGSDVKGWGKRHCHYHKGREGVGDQADPAPWAQQEKSFKNFGQS